MEIALKIGSISTAPFPSITSSVSKNIPRLNLKGREPNTKIHSFSNNGSLPRSTSNQDVEALGTSCAWSVEGVAISEFNSLCLAMHVD
ncbi:uncharacterized protein LOC131232625 isoform X3 [Magnolia sinica]|uniref:uncharacterized protein LOC131232625 isoform X3 n=1 Tax=Magnolia sinica TaxID=86752 RepID=UPI00265A988B|nr:uncharacterized protein LOC131232625 isoform X3 [Magnolia sinica]